VTPTTPIAVFTYNRSAHTQRVLESLANCACLDRCTVFIYSDGAKNESDAESVQRTRVIVDEFAARLTANRFCILNDGVPAIEKRRLNNDSRGPHQIYKIGIRYLTEEDDLSGQARSRNSLQQSRKIPVGRIPMIGTNGSTGGATIPKTPYR
jgi:hypothetical protein